MAASPSFWVRGRGRGSAGASIGVLALDAASLAHHESHACMNPDAWSCGSAIKLRQLCNPSEIKVAKGLSQDCYGGLMLMLSVGVVMIGMCCVECRDVGVLCVVMRVVMIGM